MSLTVQVYQGRDWAERLHSTWTELVDDSPTATMFQTWEWQSSWWSQYRGTKRPLIYVFYDGIKVVGILPMTRTRGLWCALLPMGHGKSDYLHPISRAGHEEEVGKASAEVLREAPGFDYVSLSMIRENQPVLRYIDPKHIAPQYSCFVLELPSEFDPYLATLSESLRRYLKRFDRNSKDSGDYQVRLAVGADVGPALEVLFDLHSKRWHQRGMPGGFAFQRNRELYRLWTKLADERDWLRLHILDGPNGPIAANLAAKIGRTTYYHNIGFNPKYSNIRPGWVILGASIRDAIDNGCLYYDFMLGDEEYKKKWKPQLRFQNHRVTIVRQGVKGILANYWYDSGLTMLIVLRRKIKSIITKRNKN